MTWIFFFVGKGSKKPVRGSVLSHHVSSYDTGLQVYLRRRPPKRAPFTMLKRWRKPSPKSSEGSGKDKISPASRNGGKKERQIKELPMVEDSEVKEERKYWFMLVYSISCTAGNMLLSKSVNMWSQGFELLRLHFFKRADCFNHILVKGKKTNYKRKFSFTT